MFTEMLEKRVLLTTMTINGTSAADTIALAVSGGFVTATVNGTPSAQSDLIVTDVTINGLGGNDIIEIHGNGTNAVTVNAGAGNDQIRITPNSMQLGSLGDTITVNGEGDNDSVILFDNNETASQTWQISSTVVNRSLAPEIIFGTVESLVIEGGSANEGYTITGTVAATTLTINGNGGNEGFRVGAIGSTIHLNGGATSGAGVGDTIVMLGNGSNLGTYSPSGTTAGSGSFILNSRTINFTSIERVDTDSFLVVRVATPHADDALNIAAVSTVQSQLGGTSGGVGITPLLFGNLNTLHLDLADNETAASTDTVSVASGGMVGASLLRVEAGTGANALTLNGGTAMIDANFGVNSGNNLDVVLKSGSVATFAGQQFLGGLVLGGNSEARMTGSNVFLTVKNLSITDGTSNALRMAAAQSTSVGDTFSIAAGARLVKEGAGNLNVLSEQTHAAGALLRVEDGTLNLHTDAGAPGSRTLAISSDAIVNLASTQHLAGVFADIGGVINMTPSGDRVLVTGAVAVNGEGGAINLNDNDMILDYSGASEIENVRLLLRGGFANGAWNGIGINSTSAAGDGGTALGYAEATDRFSTFPATFAGEQVDNTSVLIKYTFYGDYNFDGQTNLSDFNILAANFGTSNKRWVNGDGDYDLLVNLADFNRLASAFGRSGLGRGNSLANQVREEEFERSWAEASKAEEDGL